MSMSKNCDWKHLLQEGNNFYHQENWNKAEAQYQKAFQHLMSKCESCPNDSDSLMALICTCHNLSSLFEIQNKLPAAMRYLLLPHEHCRHLVAAHDVHEDHKLLAIKALSLTWEPLLVFARKYPHLSTSANITSLSPATQSSNEIH